MATCTALNGVAKSCENNIGSITEVYLYDSEDVTSITESNGTASALVLATGTAGQQFVIKRNTSNFTEEAAIDLVNGSSFVTQTINLMFHRREASKSYAIQLLGEGQRDLTAIVKDGNGLYWVFDELQLTAVGEGSGTAKADGSKYSLALTGEAVEYSWEVAYATLTTFDSVLFP
jgi:hypothetical protein